MYCVSEILGGTAGLLEGGARRRPELGRGGRLRQTHGSLQQEDESAPLKWIGDVVI